MSVEPTRERIEALIAAEAEQLDRITAFVEGGVRAGRIAEPNAAALLAAARSAHDANVRLLRGLIDEDAGTTPPGAQ